jgi:hypothetical protein
VGGSVRFDVGLPERGVVGRSVRLYVGLPVGAGVGGEEGGVVGELVRLYAISPTKTGLRQPQLLTSFIKRLSLLSLGCILMEQGTRY